MVHSVWKKWFLRTSRFLISRSRSGLRRQTAVEMRSSWVAETLEQRVLLSNITVTNGTDVAGAHTGITLRDAVNQANLDLGADTINFDSSLNGAAIQLSQGQLTITDS